MPNTAPPVFPPPHEPAPPETPLPSPSSLRPKRPPTSTPPSSTGPALLTDPETPFVSFFAHCKTLQKTVICTGVFRPLDATATLPARVCVRLRSGVIRGRELTRGYQSVDAYRSVRTSTARGVVRGRGGHMREGEREGARLENPLVFPLALCSPLLAIPSHHLTSFSFRTNSSARPPQALYQDGCRE